MKSFWKDLPRPFFALAPMEDVTDTVFRRMVISCGKPDVFFTEFTNVEGILSHAKDAVIHRLVYTDRERPLIAQIWGDTPEHFTAVAKLLVGMGFDGIDINMGCPENKIVKKGSCSGLIKNPKRALEIIEATRAGAGDLPVSVKTRLGYNTIEIEEWIGFLLSQKLDALTVHLRTRSEMSKCPAHWEEMGNIITLRDKISPETVVIGNGDILSYTEGVKKHTEYGVDGLMIGRGIFHDIFLFSKNKSITVCSVKERLELLTTHINLYRERWGDERHFDIMRKFYKVYLNGFEGASQMRLSLMEFNDARSTLEKISQLIEVAS